MTGDEMREFFGEPISVYTRAQAIDDGVLVDVSDMAKQAGFTYPTAVTVGVFSECVKVPEGVRCQDEAGRLWDVLWMLRCAVKRSTSDREVRYQLHVRNDNRPGTPPLVSLKAAVGPGDSGEPVITIMLPDED